MPKTFNLYCFPSLLQAWKAMVHICEGSTNAVEEPLRKESHLDVFGMSIPMGIMKDFKVL
jgi:hypothetical protein